MNRITASGLRRSDLPTHALLPGSPAINQGSNPLGLTFDQRGTGFPRTVDGQTDIGAFEQSVLPPTVKNVFTNDNSGERLDLLESLSCTFTRDVAASIDVGDLSVFEKTLGMPPAPVDLTGATPVLTT